MIFFPLPQWLRRRCPEAHLTVMSAYRGLWNEVAGVDVVTEYQDLTELLAALRSEAELIVMVDFEKPGLVPAMARDSQKKRFLEISLGACRLEALDPGIPSSFELVRKSHSTVNFYHSLDQLMRGIGLEPQPGDRAPQPGDRAPRRERNRNAKRSERFTIFVSPFTAKFDPSELFWAELLSQMIAPEEVSGFRLSLNPGANAATRAFAVTLARLVRSLAPAGLEIVIPQGADGKTLSLAEIFAVLYRCDALVTVDSFLAHAGPYFEGPAIVIGRRGLEKWRVPGTGNFYFDESIPVPELSAAIRPLLQPGGPEGSDHSQPISEFGTSLMEPARELAELRDHFHDHDEVLADWRHARGRFASTLLALGDQPLFLRTLASDCDYHHFFKIGAGATAEIPQDDLLSHFEECLEEWENSNLFKFFRAGMPVPS